MKKHFTYVVVIGLIGAVIFLLWNNVLTTTVEPHIHKSSYNETAILTNWLAKGDSLYANFSGYFTVSIGRDFNNKIILMITPKEGARTTHIKVLVKRKFANGLYIEVMPPYQGKVEISEAFDQEGVGYLVQVHPEGNSGEGTYGMAFIDLTSEKSIKMKITVEVQYGFRRYRGTFSAVILDPLFKPLA